MKYACYLFIHSKMQHFRNNIIIIIIIIAFSFQLSSAQNKYDNIWIIGGPYYEPAGNTQGGMILNFLQSPPEITFFENIVDFGGIAVISDSSGNLVGYSSGCNIINSEYKIVEGSNDINEGDTHELYCTYYGYPFLQGFMFLTMPGNEKSYVLIHEWRFLHSNQATELKYSVLKINTQFPLGYMIEKNLVAGNGFFADQLSAVQHANGRDWWLTVPYYNLEFDTHAYYHFLLDPTGLHFSHRQDFPEEYWDNYYWPGQTCFSPDGRYYARADPQNGLIVFDFDRCEGMLSHPRRATLNDDVETGAAGVAFSPNSRFLYANTLVNIYQHDMNVPDLQASQTLVAEFDYYYHQGVVATVFFQEALAPDGKIYISVPNTVPYLHVIHQPDKKAPFCEVEQRGLPLPVKNSWTVPNIPHFRTGPVDGSACDTLGIDAPIVEPPDPPDTPDCIGQGLKIAPNPVSEVLYIGNYSCGEVSIYNVLGQLVKEMDTTQELVWDVRAIPSGVYYVVLRKDGRVVEVKPVVVSMY